MKRIIIHNLFTITHPTSIPTVTVMPSTGRHRFATKRRRLQSINITPIITIHANLTQQVITQTYRTLFIRITRRLTRIRTIIIIITTRIKTTDLTRASVLTISVFYRGNRNRRRNKTKLVDLINRRFIYEERLSDFYLMTLNLNLHQLIIIIDITRSMILIIISIITST